jgi:hypothetical protein
MSQPVRMSRNSANKSSFLPLFENLSRLCSDVRSSTFINFYKANAMSTVECCDTENLECNCSHDPKSIPPNTPRIISRFLSNSDLNEPCNFKPQFEKIGQLASNVIGSFSTGHTSSLSSYSPPVSDIPQHSGIARDWTLLFEAHRDAVRSPPSSTAADNLMRQTVSAVCTPAKKAALRKRLIAASDEANGPHRDVLLAFRRVQTAVRRADQSLLLLARQQGSGSSAGSRDSAYAGCDAGGEAARQLRLLHAESAALSHPPDAAGDPVKAELEMVAARHLRDRALALRRLLLLPPPGVPIGVQGRQGPGRRLESARPAAPHL